VRGLRVEALPGAADAGPPAPAARLVLDSAIALARRYSLWRDTVTWSVVEPRVRELAAGARRSRDAYPAIWYLLARLGDRHSFMQTPNVASDWEAGRVKNAEPQVRALPDGAGYVSVPAYSGGDSAGMRAYAERMHAALAGVAPGARCGWVVDLRPNGGGNMFPMLAGLKPFLGGGQLGSFWQPGGEAGVGTYVEPWIAGREVGVEPPPSLAALEQAPVAVLTGPRTGSSGEVVTLAFRGRPRTRSFGAPTAGYTTGNERYVLPDGAAILLTVSVYVDRTGARYGGKVAPDSLVGPATTVPIPAGAPDAALDAATAWVRQAAGCAAMR
jgi:carboxyl-terminal processing protease